MQSKLIAILIGMMAILTIGCEGQEMVKNPQEPADPHGNLFLSIDDVTSKFIENSKVGKLFVLNGKVKNDYPETRGIIRVKGTLRSNGQVPVREEVVFCGNMLSDLDLANLDIGAIRQRLQNRLGDNRSNMRIGPAKQVPFMIVFSSVPENLVEFSVQVEGSSLAQ
jgi:hypothetical protein